MFRIEVLESAIQNVSANVIFDNSCWPSASSQMLGLGGSWQGERDDKLWMRNLPSFAYTVKLFISIISAGSLSIGGFSLI